MAKVIDARTLACPQPVLLTREALEEADEVITIVDNEAARDNVSRLGKNQGCEVTVEPKEDGIYLTLTKARVGPVRREHASTTGIVLFVASDVLGRGENEQLGSLLMQSFLHTLGGLRSRPGAVLFINDGVKLVTSDSLVVEELRRLEHQGVAILACGTCLTRLQLMDKVAVGQVTDMYTMADTLFRAEKIVPL